MMKFKSSRSVSQRQRTQIKHRVSNSLLVAAVEYVLLKDWLGEEAKIRWHRDYVFDEDVLGWKFTYGEGPLTWPNIREARHWGKVFGLKDGRWHEIEHYENGKRRLLFTGGLEELLRRLDCVNPAATFEVIRILVKERRR